MNDRNTLRLLLGVGVATVGIAVVHASTSSNCTGVTNCVCQDGPPKQKTCYKLGEHDWNVFCVSGGNKTCSDGNTPGTDVDKWTYANCGSVGIWSNGGRPKEKVCN